MSTRRAYLTFNSIRDLLAQLTSRMATTTSLPSVFDSDAVEPLTSFECFPKLPLELRTMIWEWSFPDCRVVSLNHNYSMGTPVTRRMIEEERPVLLSVCQESRTLVLKHYQKIFKPPSPPRSLWHYIGSCKSVDLRATLKVLGLRQIGTVESMPKVITQHMNEFPELVDKYMDFGTRREENLELISPQWYNPGKDVLLLKTPQRFWRYDKLLWCPWRVEASGIRHLAFELDHLIRVHPSFGRKRAWTNRIMRRPGSNNPVIRFDRLAEGVLDCITLLLKEDCEVITLRHDETGKLGSDEWTFSLDTETEDFREQMGPRSWSSATWRVTLGKKQDVCLWNRAAEWKVDNKLWEQDKREICRENDKVTILWHVAERCRTLVSGTTRKAQKLQGGDGKTYVGPSES